MAIQFRSSVLFRKGVSVLLISIFALAISPVVFLHDIVANHSDVSYHNVNQNGNQFSKEGINCHCISFVAEAQFINTISSFIFEGDAVFSSPYTTIKTEGFYSQHHFFAELRGPPGVA